MTRQFANPAADGTHTLRRIIDAINGLEFGAVEITVHHGRIVQIERREKLRFDRGGRAASRASESTTRD